MSVTIREERPEDSAAIRHLNDAAFGQPQEGKLVDNLRRNGGVLLSLVAIVEGRIAGHILYSPVAINSDSKVTVGAGLGPMAVLPELQRQGIGSRLIEAGIQRMREMGTPFVVVLGHPDYYPRFGFQRASKFGIHCEWDVPDEVFMILVNDREKMAGISGLAHYRGEFGDAEPA